jgi:pimeloyl-ACP methyl ester carboxylesterase
MSSSSLLKAICLLALVRLMAPPQLAMAQGRLEPDPVFGGDVYVEEAGDPSSETVVLVHGLGGGGSKDWRPVIERLESDYHVLTLDLPGFGRSAGGAADYSPTRYARLLHRLIKRHANRPFHLVGHSMGGAVALRYAASHPDEVKTLTLVDTAGLLHGMAYTKFLAPMGLERMTGHDLPAKGVISDLVGVLLEDAEARLPVDPGLLMQIPALRRKVLRDNPAAIAGYGMVEEDFSEVPERVRAPTLIVWGEHDDVAPLRTGHVLDALIPRSYLRVISGTGHMPIGDAPERFVALLRPHLDASVDPALYRQGPAVGRDHRGEVSCNGRYGPVYSGRIDRLTLNGCSDVLIRNARIGGLWIIDSNVRIEDSVIEGDDTGIRSRGSTVYLTAGRVAGDVAIEAEASRFDIAGTELVGRRSAVESISDSSFVFSLGRIDSPRWYSDVIHGYWMLGSGQWL